MKRDANMKNKLPTTEHQRLEAQRQGLGKLAVMGAISGRTGLGYGTRGL